MKVRKILLRAASILLLLFLVLVWVNYALYDKWLPIMHALAVIIAAVAYFGVLRGAMLAILHPNLVRKALGALVLLTVVYTLYDVTYWWIYQVLPKWAIVLYLPGSTFSERQFRANITDSFTTVAVVSLTSVIWTGYRRYRRSSQSTLRDLRKQIENMQLRLGANQISPHFIDGILASAMGRSLASNMRDVRWVLIKLNSVMKYVLSVDKHAGQTVSLREEWLQVKNLLEVYRWKYGADSVSISPDDASGAHVRLVPMSLLTLVENAIKYADTSHGQPLDIEMELEKKAFRFRCSNAFDPEQRKHTPSTKFGLSNLRQRLQHTALKCTLQTEEKENLFVATLIQYIPVDKMEVK